jgi:hypothetical protein
MRWKGKQVEALEATEREVDIEGALRASKTTICLWRELNAMIDSPGVHGLLARWSDDATHSILKPIWRAICIKAGVILRWNGEEQYDELPNGSRAYIKGLKTQSVTDRYSKFRGLTLARAYVDQAEEMPQDVYLELAARLSQPGHQHQITISPNAVDPDHWIAKEEFPEDNSKPNRRYISLSVYDNRQNLPPEVIPNLLRLFPPEHPKHRTMVLGLRGMNVIGVPVYKGAWKRDVHEFPIEFDPRIPLDEGIDFGRHHPCVVWRQTSALGEIRYLGGLLGQDLFLEDFLPLVLSYRRQWFGEPSAIRTTCDPAGAAANSQGGRANGVSILQSFGFYPTWRDDANSPAVRLAIVEQMASHMRKRAPTGREVFGVNKTADQWLVVSGEVARPERWFAGGFEAGYVWDQHMISVNQKLMRRPKKDGWYEHGQNCAEYLELAYGTKPHEDDSKLLTPPTFPGISGPNDWMAM